MGVKRAGNSQGLSPTALRDKRASLLKKHKNRLTRKGYLDNQKRHIWINYIN